MKPKRKPTPKHQYTWLNALIAHPVNPMPADKQAYQLTQMRLGLAAMERDADPHPNDWRCVADSINLLETMLDMGLINDEQGLLKDAVFAMGEAGKRAMQGKALRLSGAGIQACRAVIDDYAMVLASLPERTIIQAFIKTERRIRDIQAGKRRPHDVQVIAV